MATSRIKVYELAKELAVDSQHLVDIVQRLGIDIKNSMSLLGSEEVRTVRDYVRKQRPMAKATAPAAKTTSPVTEKRVGATVIRRRAKGTEEAKAPAPAHEEVEEVEAQPAEVEDQYEESVEEQAPMAAAPEPEPEPEQAQELAVEAGAEPQEQMLEEEEPAQPVEAATPSSDEPEAPTPAPSPKPRRFFPSIIKKVATEQHLSEKVGPKVEPRVRPPRPVTPPPASGGRPRPMSPRPPGTGAPSTAPAGAQAAVTAGLRRVKEVEMAPATEAAKEAGRRRLMEGQTSVFKRADYLKREMVHATKKKKNVVNRPAMKTQITTAAQHKRVVEMGDTIAVAELAKQMGLKVGALVAKLMGMGVTAGINQAVDHDTATLVAQEYGFEVKHAVFKETDFIPAVDLSDEKMKPRSPVVTIMGHVDHGKTSLLDAIRKTKVAAGEAGGITQHVGAYVVEVPKGKITFVDTPGHEAFTAMRARGAKVTDLVVLVVSAVDGVMPQTLESISHSQAANVPIIVAVNKIDLPDANPDRIKQTLAGHNLNPEEWGGNTMYVSVSAKTGKGLDQLLESILLQAEVLELKANYDVPARGTVIESRLDKNRGPIASILIQHGKLTPGAIAVCGAMFGKVRAMTSALGKKMIEVLPSEPAEILGLPSVPIVGDEFLVVENERAARDIVSSREDKVKQKMAERPRISLEEMMAAVNSEKELRIILKSDVQGSAEALKEALSKFPTDKVKMKILHTGTGGITESDVMLATASRAVILGFNVRPEVKAQKVADAEKVEIRTYSIIYELLDDVKKFLEGLLDKVVKERVIGRAEVRSVFAIPKGGTIAGSAVIDGKVIRGCYLRLLRDSRVVYEGKISSLRRFKDDVKEVAQGFECGIGLENFNDLKQGDQLEAFLKDETQGTL